MVWREKDESRRHNYAFSSGDAPPNHCFSVLPVWGAYPDLLTILVVNLGMLNGRTEGAWLEFLSWPDS